MVPVDPPLETSGGAVDTAPLVLIDLSTEEGVTGRSYLFCYAPLALEPVSRLVSELGAMIEGDTLAPLEIEHKLQSTLLLLRPQGLTGMAMSGIDMVAWDALARGFGVPLARLLGGEARPVPAYGSLKAMGLESAPKEAEKLAEAAGLPLNSHLFPEISAHLLSASPTGHLLEYLDLASPILEEPVKVENGHAIPPSGPGIGLQWDEDAIKKFST